MMKNPAPAPAGFAIKIRQNPAPAGFEKSNSGTTLHLIWHKWSPKRQLSGLQNEAMTYNDSL